MKRNCVLMILLAALVLTACSAAVAAPAPTASRPVSPEPAAAVETPEVEYAIRFSTTDRDGGEVDETIFAGQKLVVLNFWEPWCPPCVAEMPELETLYRDYRDKGLLILGIYGTEGMEDEVDKVLARCETSYPILHYVKAFDGFQTGYVPTTVFLDGEGNVLADPFVGSRDYKGWEALVLEYLK